MTHAEALPVWAAVLVSLSLLGGAGLTLIGAIGTLRFESFFERIHAPTLGTSCGAGGILLGSMIFFTVLEQRRHRLPRLAAAANEFGVEFEDAIHVFVMQRHLDEPSLSELRPVLSAPPLTCRSARSARSSSSRPRRPRRRACIARRSARPTRSRSRSPFRSAGAPGPRDPASGRAGSVRAGA